MALRKLGDDETLNFGIDWGPFLTNEGTTIASSDWTIPSELTLVADAADSDSTTVTLTANTAVIGDTFLITNIVTLANGLIAERSFNLVIVETKYK